MRPLHRRLRHGDGEDRPPGAADRLRHRRQHRAPAAPASADLSGSSGRARCSMRRSSPSSAASCCYALATRDSDASASCMTAIRCSCGCPTARSATPTRIRIVNKQLEPRQFAVVVDGPPAHDSRSSACRRATDGRAGRRSRSRPDARSARAGDRLRPAAGAVRPPIAFRITDVGDRRARERERQFLRTVRMRTPMQPELPTDATRAAAAEAHRPDGVRDARRRSSASSSPSMAS